MVHGSSSKVCPICGVEDPPYWWETDDLNPTIREAIRANPPISLRVFYPSFMAAAEAWGPHITEGLENESS